MKTIGIISKPELYYSLRVNMSFALLICLFHSCEKDNFVAPDSLTLTEYIQNLLEIAHLEESSYKSPVYHKIYMN